jgi:hypothetical protein
VETVKNTTIVGSSTTVWYEVNPPAWTSTYGVALAVDMIKPLAAAKVAPFVGVGVFAGYGRQSLQYTDDLTLTDFSTTVDNYRAATTIGARGVVGLSWRIHESFSLYAEYHLRVDAVTWSATRDRSTITDSSAGTPATSQTTSEHQETTYFNVDTALGQGGALGLIAYF